MGVNIVLLCDQADATGGFAQTRHEISVVKDLIEHDRMLFDIKDMEIDKENRIEEAIKKIMQLNNVAKRLSQVGCAFYVIQVTTKIGGQKGKKDVGKRALKALSSCAFIVNC